MSVSTPGRSNVKPRRRDLLQALTLRNLLSFGPDTPQLPLGALNVLVGPNGSGKSNLLEAIDLLRSTPGDLGRFVSLNGGVSEWIWKGTTDAQVTLIADFDDRNVPTIRDATIQHSLQLRSAGPNVWVTGEQIVEQPVELGQGGSYGLYSNQNGRAFLSSPLVDGGNPRELARTAVPTDNSILTQRRDPDFYAELASLAHEYGRIRLYREWSFGRSAVLRRPQQADLRTDRLEEDFSNLGLILNRMRRQPRTKAALLERLRDLYDGLTDVDVRVEGGTVQVFFAEGDYVIPATRLSDGSLRYLCLLVILLDPDPPPLIGLEEPELGLHPDLLPKIADLLVDASTRTQLIVTTHSDVIIDALSDRPECVVVFEKHEGRTTFERLDRAALADWLTKYRLGQLWTRGQIGGTRW